MGGQGLFEEEEARQLVLGAVGVLGDERVGLAGAVGRYLWEQELARVALPGFDNSAFDGYAVRAADAVAGAVLRVVGEQAAGLDLGLRAGRGEAVRIFTGAPMVAGADAILMQEDADVVEGGRVRVREAVVVGEGVRRAGSDLCVGQVLAARGTRVTGRLVGLLASQGMGEVRVGRLPRVVVMPTGDELVRAGCALRPGQLYESNGAMLVGLLGEKLGVCAEVRPAVGDAPGAMRDALGEALAGADAVIVSGGVSVGEHDHVREAARGLGYDVGLWRVRVKPGKPFLFGRPGEEGGGVLFGLPGNPVSTAVSFELFALPALRKMAGAGEVELGGRLRRGVLGEGVANRGDRPSYVRGSWRGEGREFVAWAGQGSHSLAGLARAEGLLRLEAGEELEAGAEVVVREL